MFFRSQHGCLCKKQTNKQIDNFLCEVEKKTMFRKWADVINIGHFHILITGYHYFSCRMFLNQKNFFIPLVSIISITIALRLYDFLNHEKIEQKKTINEFYINRILSYTYIFIITTSI